MLDAILIRDVTLPQTLRAAIEQKLKQEQEALEYEFKIDKAKKEAERKEIEAKGISEFKKLLQEQLLLNYLSGRVLKLLKKYLNLLIQKLL